MSLVGAIRLIKEHQNSNLLHIIIILYPCQCRYGKFAVLDLLDIENAWTAMNVKFEDVKKGLLSDLMSKELMKDER